MDSDYEKLFKIEKAVEKAERVIASGRCNWANTLYELIEDINKVINPVVVMEVNNASH